MASRAEYRKGLRQRLRDWPKKDVLASDISSATATTFTATIGSLYEKGGTIRIDDEEMLVRNISTNTITVMRGWNGTTASTHTQNATVYIFRFFSDEELNRFIEAAVRALWPGLYAEGLDTTTTLSIDTYEYDYPTAIADVGGTIVDAEAREDVDTPGTPVPFRLWGGKIRLPRDYSGTLCVYYIYPYPVPADDNTDIGVPTVNDELVYLGAEYEALTSMMADRGKYEKYVASQWRENSTGYELESHVKMIRQRYEDSKKAQTLAHPSYRRL